MRDLAPRREFGRSAPPTREPEDDALVPFLQAVTQAFVVRILSLPAKRWSLGGAYTLKALGP